MPQTAEVFTPHCNRSDNVSDSSKEEDETFSSDSNDVDENSDVEFSSVVRVSIGDSADNDDNNNDDEDDDDEGTWDVDEDVSDILAVIVFPVSISDSNNVCRDDDNDDDDGDNTGE